MPTFSKNTRRSASSVGLVSNITYPAPNGSILDSNSDGSDLRHIAGIYRGETIYNPEGGVSTVISAASFGFSLSLYPISNSAKTYPISLGIIQDLNALNNLTKTSSANLSILLDSQFLNNLTKTITVDLGIELSSQFAQIVSKTASSSFYSDLSTSFVAAVGKTAQVELSTTISSSFNNNLTKTVSTSFVTDLSSNFVGTAGTILTAPQVSFSIEEGLSAYPTLLSLLSSPKIFLSVDNNVQLLSNLGKTTTVQISEDLNSQLTPNLTKTASVGLDVDQSIQLSSALTKTIAGLSFGLDLDTTLLLTRIKAGSVIFSIDLDSQFGLNLTKSTSLSLGLSQGVFISGVNKSIAININFASDLCSQFKATAPSILDSNPSTFCWTVYICKEVDFNGYITQTKSFSPNLKNRC